MRSRTRNVRLVTETQGAARLCYASAGCGADDALVATAGGRPQPLRAPARPLPLTILCPASFGTRAVPRGEVRLTLHDGEILVIADQGVSRVCENLWRPAPVPGHYQRPLLTPYSTRFAAGGPALRPTRSPSVGRTHPRSPAPCVAPQRSVRFANEYRV